MENRKNDLELAANGASATSDSEYANEPGCTGEVIDGIISTPEDFSNRWHSSVNAPHPHWVEVHLRKTARISKVVIHFADPAGHPVSFEGIIRTEGRQQRVIQLTDNRETRDWRAEIEPVMTDTFRISINTSANPAYPNAAQLSENESYP